MKLTVLSENAVLYPGLEGEFGLSVYLEEGDARLLFDAGERDACLRNAEKLGIDLRRVTAVAFSHNHRDHCGGSLLQPRKLFLLRWIPQSIRRRLPSHCLTLPRRV